MANIQKRAGKSGPTYRVQVRMKGFPTQTRSFDRLTDTKAWAQETETAIRKGEFQNVIKTAATKTLQDVVDRYRTEVFVRKAETTKRAEVKAPSWPIGSGSLANTPSLISTPS